MKPLLQVLYGALVAAVLTGSMGWLLLGRLRARLFRYDAVPAAMLAGTPLLTALVFLLARVHLLTRGSLQLLALALLLLAIWRRNDVTLNPGVRLPAWMLTLMAAAGVLFAGMAASQAAAPNSTPSSEQSVLLSAIGMWLHISKPHFDLAPLMAVPYRFGGESAAALFHCLYLPLLALSAMAAARRWMNAFASLAAGLLVLSAQTLDVFAQTAGGQLFVIFVVFAGFWILAVALHSRQWLLLGALPLVILLLARKGPIHGQAFGGLLFDRLPWVLIPFAALLLAWLVHRQKGWGAALLALQCVTAIPIVSHELAPSNARTPATWQSWSVITRHDALDPAVYTKYPDYLIARLIDGSTPKDAQVLLAMPFTRTWVTRETNDSPELLRLLDSAYSPAAKPSRVWTQRVPATPRQRFVVPRHGAISEVRFYREGNEVPRAATWKIRTADGERRASWAFDNNPITACDCSVEVDFGAALSFDEVRTTGSQGTPGPAIKGLRRAAVLTLKGLGVTHILARENTALSDELTRNASYWGVKELGERNGAHLFQLQ